MNRRGEFHRHAGLFILVTVEPRMSLLPRKGLLAIAAVIDVALHARGHPVAAKALASRHRLPPRHLEPVLQALVRQGVLKGVRGPRGGYELAREPRRITAHDILRAIGTIEGAGDGTSARSALLAEVVMPALAQAEGVFSGALGHINIEDLVVAAQTRQKLSA
jgi:Rrf2 family transcriptional regulator, iron-sulfur cluster assembly transcription factor